MLFIIYYLLLQETIGSHADRVWKLNTLKRGWMSEICPRVDNVVTNDDDTVDADVAAKWAADDGRTTHSSRAETSGRNVHLPTTVSHQQNWRRQILGELSACTLVCSEVELLVSNVRLWFSCRPLSKSLTCFSEIILHRLKLLQRCSSLHTSWHTLQIGRVSCIRIYLCYFCLRWKTVSLVQASLQYLMHHVTVSRQQSKITLQNNCINNTSITQPTLSFYLWLKM